MVCQVCGGKHALNQACASSQPGGVSAGAPSRPLLNHAEGTRGDPLLGTTLGSFRLVRKLGKGGMGTVYLGEQTLIGSKVAVKVLHGDLAADPAAVARFHAEARAVNMIGHENIVSIFDMGVAQETHYFVMEYLEGQPLTNILQGPVDPKVAIPILTQVCDALSAAHHCNVVHRDLKPDNIFLVRRGKDERFVKVLDFGVAKLLTAEVGQTAHGMCIGTPTYMAPEQWLGQGVDGRADIYALGILMYRMATGQLPFPRGGMLEMMTYHREKTPPAPHLVNPVVSPAWSAVIMKCVAKRAEERYQRASDLGRALEGVLREDAERPVTELSPVAEASQAQAKKEERAEPQPSQVPLRARVSSVGGAELFTANCTDISRGGMFICHEGPLPPLFTRFKVRLELPDRTLDCVCEVVRHVSAREASAWHMSPGFGVQFMESSPAFKACISQVLETIRAPSSPTDVLKHYQAVEEGDHYRLLQLSPNADFAEVKRVAQKARNELTSLLSAPLTVTERQLAQRMLERVGDAERTLGAEATRVEYDARKHNFRGVARCIDAGISPQELATARERYLSDQPRADNSSVTHLQAGSELERTGRLPEALSEYERGLAVDPLNLELQRKYWALHRKTIAPQRIPRAESHPSA